MEPINLLVTLDENYISPLCVMLKSLFLNNPGERFHIYLIHSAIPQKRLSALSAYCQYHRAELHPVLADAEMFAGAPVFRYLSKAMYYRLLACKLLPEDLDRALYLDPDTMLINPVRALYDIGLDKYLFAGCVHTGLSGIAGQVNKIRLNTYEAEGYFNSGVLLMNLQEQRKKIDEKEIFDYTQAHRNELILPDQDILNGLYSKEIKPLDDSIYNYDPKRYETYRMVSGGEKDIDWVMKNTVILHFCGKNKPWIKPHRSRFGILYKHYAVLAERTLQQLEPAKTR